MNKLSKTRVTAFVLFVIFIPLRPAALWIGGSATTGKVTSVSPSCAVNGPQPSFTVAYSVKGQDRKAHVGGRDGVEICQRHVGDEVKITYFDLLDYTTTTAGDPKSNFFSWLTAGIGLNVVLNILIYIFKPWMRE